jgi:hypothetical protein
MLDWNITGTSLQTNRKKRPASANIRRPTTTRSSSRFGSRRPLTARTRQPVIRPFSHYSGRRTPHQPFSARNSTHNSTNNASKQQNQRIRNNRHRPWHGSSRDKRTITSPHPPPPPPPPSRPSTATVPRTTEARTTASNKVLQPSSDLLNLLAGFGLNQFYSERSPSYVHPADSTNTNDTTTGTTTSSLPMKQLPRNEASFQELQEALRIWLHEIDQTSFQSFAVFCEYKLRRSTSQASQWSSPNAFGTSVAWICLLRAAESLPNYRGLFEALAQTIGPSIYCNYDQVTTKLLYDGGEDDAWTLFDSETYYNRSKRMGNEIVQLRHSLNSMLESLKKLKGELTEQSLFSSLGLVSETFRDSSNSAAVLMSREWKQKQLLKHQCNLQNNSSNNKKDNIVVHIKEEVSDIEVVMRSLSSMTDKTLETFMTDVATNRNEFVSVNLLSDLFGISPTSSRNSFISVFWRLLHHTEKAKLLSTIPIRLRDENLRDTLEQIVLQSELPYATSDTNVQVNQQPMEYQAEGGQADVQQVNITTSMSDSTIIKFVKHACQAAIIANESESREFLHRMMCALEMLRVGEQQMSASSSVELPNDPQSVIESRAREIVRLWHVEKDKCEKIQDQLIQVKEELIEANASVRTMARVQSKMNEYKYSSTQIRSEENGVSVEMDASINGGKVVWPILHHTAHPRRHSLHRIIDRYYEEETIRTGGYVASTSRFGNNKRDHSDIISLEEVHSAIATFYNSALMSAGVGSKMYSMAEIMKLHLLCEYGEIQMAIEHCQRIDIALRTFHQTDQRCHLFAMLCGSVEGNSFLNRPETSQFVATALAHMMKASVVEGITCVQDMFEIPTSEEEATKTFHCDRAKTVVRNLFRVQGEDKLENHVSCRS